MPKPRVWPIRHVRRDGLDVIKKLEKEHKISQDDHERFSTEIQKATDQLIHEVDQLLAQQGKGNPHGVRITHEV